MSRHVITASGLAWLPLLILTLIHDFMSRHDLVYILLSDPVPYARYLIAIPIFLGMTPIIDRWTSSVLQHFTTTGIVSDSDIQQMSNLMSRMLRMRDSVVPEIIMLAAAYSNSFFQIYMEKSISPMLWLMTKSDSTSSLTMAGWWNYLFSLPLFGFLALIWIWRFLVWSYFLMRVSRYNLRLVPIHPDFAGGIAFLTIPQRTFGGINLAFGIVIAAGIAQNIIYRGASAFDYKTSALAYSLIAPVIILAPLVVFVSSLVRTRYSGLIKYSALADEYTEAFDDKWVARYASEDDELLGTSDIQSLADLANSFSIIRNMKIFPFTLKDYVILAIISSVPFLPLVLTVIPAKELLIKLAGLMFG